MSPSFLPYALVLLASGVLFFRVRAVRIALAAAVVLTLAWAALASPTAKQRIFQECERCRVHAKDPGPCYSSAQARCSDAGFWPKPPTSCSCGSPRSP